MSSILITGADGGIGLAMVKNALSHKPSKNIIATVRGRPSPELLDMSNCKPERLVIIGMDITNEDSISKATERTRALDYSISIAINCAGILHGNSIRPEKRLSDLTLASMKKVFEINTFGPMAVAKHMEKCLVKNELKWINLTAKVGSIGDNHLGGWYSYRSSKTALNMMTKTLAIEFARTKKNSCCIALHPGTTDTKLSKPYQSNRIKNLNTTAVTASRLWKIIDAVTPNDTGKFFSWDGNEIEW